MKKVKVKVKKRKINVRKIIVFLLVLYVLYFVISSIITFKISNIYVTGNDLISDKEIIVTANLEDYPSFIFTSTLGMKKKLLKNNFIKSVKINKKLPSSIILDIEEYRYLFYDSLSEKVILENGNKYINKYKYYDMPILITDVDDEIWDDFIASFNLVNENVMTQISEVAYSPTNVDKKRFILKMKDTNIVYINLNKINEVNKYNEIKLSLENKVGTIYLDSGNYFEARK